MKIFNKTLSTIFLLFFILGYSQKNDELSLDKPSEGNSLIYFSRVGSGAFMVNFRLYDGDKFLGPIASGEYFVYETQPGNHIFWATSENRSFVDANLEPNKIYFIQMNAEMGAFVAGVGLQPYKPTDAKHQKQVYKTVKSGTKKTLTTLPTDDKSDNIQKGLDKYKELKAKNSKQIKILKSTDNFVHANKLL